MKSVELFYPQIKANVGGYSLQKGIEIETSSSVDSYYDWAKIKFTEQFQGNVSFNKKDPALIYLGYSNNFNQVFKGYVQKSYSQSNSNEVLMKDDMLLLEETEITNTFMDTTPQEMLKYCLNKAGISEFKLADTTYPSKAVVPVRTKNVINTINQIHSTWGIEQKFYFSDGKFYWGEKPDQEMIYNFEYGNNIISLQKEGGMWNMETVSVPFVKHSHKINITHPNVSGTYEVKKVTFHTKDTGFIRANIYF